ncbi:hypothetical protein Tco_0842273, partial [Tanacetum coccineum]
EPVLKEWPVFEVVSRYSTIILTSCGNELNAGHLDTCAKLKFYSNLEVCVKVLLEPNSGVVNANIKLEEEHGTLLEEYWNMRDILLATLYQKVKGFNQTTYELDVTPSKSDSSGKVTMGCDLGCDFKAQSTSNRKRPQKRGLKIQFIFDAHKIPEFTRWSQKFSK